MASKTEKKNNTRSRIVSYVMNNADTSKVEISKNLNMSMPTVLSNVNELMAGNMLLQEAEKPRVSGSIPVTAMQWVFVSLPIM